jgi:TP901 family phage tail tape measure protein
VASRSDVKAGRAYVELFVKDNMLTRGLNSAGAKLKSWGQGIAQAGRTGVMASAAMLAPVAAAVKVFANFDDKVRAVRAVTGASAADFAMLTDTAKELGRTTSFTAGNVADLMTELGRAGFNATQINGMTESVLSLSRATGTEAAQAAGIMAASLRQFNMGASDAARVSDALTVAANKSFNTVEQLGEALSYVGPTAASFGMSIEDTLAILGALGNVGIQGSNAGTAVRRLLTLTGAEAQKLNKIFGVTFTDAAGNARPLVDVMEEIGAATAGLGSAEKSSKFNEAFGLLGITGAQSLAGNIGSVRELRKELAAAAGTAKKTADEMDAGIGGGFRKLGSAIEGVAIAIGEALAPDVAKTADMFTSLSGTLTTFIAKNARLVQGVKTAVVALGVVSGVAVVTGTALSGIGFALSGAATIMATIGTAIGFALSPLGLLTIALGAGVTAWAMYTDSGQKAVAAFQTGFSGILETAKTTIGGIGDALMAGDLETAGEIALLGLKIAARQGLEALGDVFGGYAGRIVNAIGNLFIDGDVQGAWDAALQALDASALAVTDSIIDYFVDLGVEIAGTMSDILKAATPFLRQMADAAGGMLDNLPLQSLLRGGLLGSLDPFGGAATPLSGAQVAGGANLGLDLMNQGLDQVVGDIQQAADAFKEAGAQDRQQRRAGLDALISPEADAKRQADRIAEQARMDALRQLVKDRADAAAMAMQDKAAADAATGGGGGAGGGGAGGIVSGVAGSFSAAALGLLGQSGGPQERAAKAAEKAVVQNDELIQLDEMMLAELKKTGLAAFQ